MGMTPGTAPAASTLCVLGSQKALEDFLGRFPVSMIQTRNLNMDPDYYFEQIGFSESEPMGVRKLIGLLREKYPKLRLGYYNPPLR